MVKQWSFLWNLWGTTQIFNTQVTRLSAKCDWWIREIPSVWGTKVSPILHILKGFNLCVSHKWFDFYFYLEGNSINLQSAQADLSTMKVNIIWSILFKMIRLRVQKNNLGIGHRWLASSITYQIITNILVADLKNLKLTTWFWFQNQVSTFVWEESTPLI